MFYLPCGVFWKEKSIRSSLEFGALFKASLVGNVAWFLWLWNLITSFPRAWLGIHLAWLTRSSMQEGRRVSRPKSECRLRCFCWWCCKFKISLTENGVLGAAGLGSISELPLGRYRSSKLLQGPCENSDLHYWFNDASFTGAFSAEDQLTLQRQSLNASSSIQRFLLVTSCWANVVLYQVTKCILRN